MLKVIVTEEFTLRRFNELKNIERANPNQKEYGHLYVNDKFECNEEMYEFLTIKNNEKRAFIKKIEIIPEKKETTTIIVDDVVRNTIGEKPKRRKKSVAQK